MVSTFNINGQVAKWLIPPAYDNIYMANDEDLIFTDSANYKVIWSFSGKRLAVTADQVLPYREGLAVTMEKGTNFISGFYDRGGKFTPLTGCSAYNRMPFFFK